MIRSLLFLPGNNPNMIANGDILGADAVILDLEDAVAPDEKDAARILVRNALKYLNLSNVKVIIRINCIDDNNFWKQDLDEVIPHSPHIIMPTKVDSAAYVHTVSEYISFLEEKHNIAPNSIKIMPLIETALGLENAFSIAAADKRIFAIFLGAEDLTADLRCERTKEGSEIFYARSRIVAAARAAQVMPIDTPFTDVNDDDGVYNDARTAKALGFSGKAAISPRHVKAINKTFSPTAKDIEYAHEVLDAINEAKAKGKGAVSLNGKMIDKPIVMRANQVIEIDRLIKQRGGVGL